MINIKRLENERVVEIELYPDSDQEFFKAIAAFMENELQLSFKQKLSTPDQWYWDFSVDNHIASLHLEHYSGISIFLGKPVESNTLERIDSIADRIAKHFNHSKDL